MVCFYLKENNIWTKGTMRKLNWPNGWGRETEDYIIRKMAAFIPAINAVEHHPKNQANDKTNIAHAIDVIEYNLE